MRSASSPRVRAIALGVLAALAASVAVLWFELVGSDSHEVPGSAVSAVELTASADASAVRSVAACPEPASVAERVLGRSLPCAVDVRVVDDESGAPIARAEVWLEPGSPSGGDGLVRTTDSDGVARIGDLRPGEAIVRARAAGREDGRVTIPLGIRLVETAPIPSVDVRLGVRHGVQVRLVNARGQDLALADLGMDGTAHALSLGVSRVCGAIGGVFDGSGAPTSRARLQSWGGRRLAWRVEIEGGAACCLNVLLGNEVLATSFVTAETTDVAIVLERETLTRAAAPIRIRVVTDPGEVPIAGAMVVVASPNGQPRTLATDVDGVARIEGSLEAEFGIAVNADGRAPESRRVWRPILEDVVFRLREGHLVDGSVLVGGEIPSGPLWIVACDARDLGKPTRPLACTTTNEAGRFAFELLPTDWIVLCIVASDAVVKALPARSDLPETYFVLGPGGLQDVELRLPRGIEEQLQPSMFRPSAFR